MRYNVAELLKGPSGGARQYQVDEEPGFELSGARIVGPLQGQVQLMRTDRGVEVVADLSAPAEVECARCLKPAETELSIHMEDEYRPSVDIRTGFHLWPDPGETLDEEFLIGPDHVLDLDEAIRQELEAAVPMKALCSNACVGLCPQCGQDWNKGQCDCRPEEDVRWEALRSAFDESATP